ncbi:hypothetical protein pb186bvf_000716 [Paramecium bursaria]
MKQTYGRLILYDGNEETKFGKRGFQGSNLIFKIEHGYDSINFLWEASPMNTKNDFKFQKVTNVNRHTLDSTVKDSFSLPQLYKRRNSLFNEFVVSPSQKDGSLNYSRHVPKPKEDSDIFGNKLTSNQFYTQSSDKYGQFFSNPGYRPEPQKPCLTYHSSKSQIFGNKRLQQIKLKQEL